jgi:protein-disulfide isomerase
MDIRRTARLLALGFLGLGASAALAAADGSQLALPPGATVAIVVFEDLQCPDCARAHPGLLAASKASNVPLVIHDFPITRHVWAFPAAVLARYFTLQSPELGVEFRSFIFENQKDITPDNLRGFGERFAAEHQVQLPPDIDPDGKLQALVQADFDLGKQIHLEYVPLMFVLGPGLGASNFVEVMDPAEIAGVVARAGKAASP